MQHTGQKKCSFRRTSSSGAGGAGGRSSSASAQQPERKKKKTSYASSSSTSISNNERIPSNKKRIVEMECKKLLASQGPDALRQINAANIWDEYYDVLSEGGYGFDAFRMLVRRVRMNLLGEKEERRSGSGSSRPNYYTQKNTNRRSSSTSATTATTASTTSASSTMTSSNSSRSIPENKKRLVEDVCRAELAQNGIDSLKRLLPVTVWDQHHEVLSAGNYAFSAFKAYYTRARAAIIEQYNQNPTTKKSQRMPAARSSSTSSSTSNSSSSFSRIIPIEKKRLVQDVCMQELRDNGVDGLRRLLPASVWDEHYAVLSAGNYEFTAFKAYYTRTRASIIEEHTKSNTAKATAAGSGSARSRAHHRQEQEQEQEQEPQDDHTTMMFDTLQQQVDDLATTVQQHTADLNSAQTNQQQLERAISSILQQQQQQSTSTTSTTTTTTTEPVAESNSNNNSNNSNKFCIFCGTNLPTQAAFCCSCGNKQCTFPSNSQQASSGSE